MHYTSCYELKCRLRIADADPPCNLLHKLCQGSRSAVSAKIRHHENSHGKLTNCCVLRTCNECDNIQFPVVTNGYFLLEILVALNETPQSYAIQIFCAKVLNDISDDKSKMKLTSQPIEITIDKYKVYNICLVRIASEIFGWPLNLWQAAVS